MSKPRLNEDDYRRAAKTLGCDVAAVKAVSEVESRGDGFLEDDRPKVLFEGQWFHKFTNGKFAAAHPTISYPAWTTKFYLGDIPEWDKRLSVAMALDKYAAIRATSFGKFQVMGFNFNVAFSTLDAFWVAMHESEGRHLDAFVGYVIKNGLSDALKTHNWPKFAYGYNGEGYKVNNYDGKMAAAWQRFNADKEAMPDFSDVVGGVV